MSDVSDAKPAKPDPRLRQLTIKTGVVKRLAKEKTCYQKEAVQLEQKVEKMKADGKDSHEIKKQEEVLLESVNMVPDCERRLKTAYEDLENMIKELEELSECKEYATAQEVLENARAQLPA